MTRFRPCIDLHHGKVKQIVGGSLSDSEENLRTNFVSEQPAEFYAAMYRADDLRGGHVIKLGSGNETAALTALGAYPNGLQLGGGVTAANAASYLAAGASHVIVTSMLFDTEGQFQETRLAELTASIGRRRLVIDLSCRRVEGGWRVAMNRWQTLTDLAVTKDALERLAHYGDEFLIHAADVEGRCQGMDEDLIERLGDWAPIPTTYAGGARGLEDLARADQLSQGRVDLTIGSALDIFGGSGTRYADCLRWNQSGGAKNG